MQCTRIRANLSLRARESSRTGYANVRSARTWLGHEGSSLKANYYCSKSEVDFSVYMAKELRDPAPRLSSDKIK